MDTSYYPSGARFWTAIFVAGVFSCLLKLRKGLRSVHYLPGFRVPFHPYTLPGVLIGTRWGNPAIFFVWLWRASLYKERDTVSIVPFILGVPTVVTSNLEVMRHVLSSHRREYVKTEKMTVPIRTYGINLLAAEGNVWRTHRRVVGPTFNNELYTLVWAQSLRTYHEMQATEGWDGEDVVTTDACQKLTTKFTLLIIVRCGFGFSFDWTTPSLTEDGEIPIQEALSDVEGSHLLHALAPRWLFRIPLFGLPKLRKSYAQLGAFMHSRIDEKRVHLSGESVSSTKDVFTGLIKANESEEPKYRLDDSELIGNVFLLLIAGHESTAHALDATLALLALHPDLQTEIYDQVVAVVGLDRDPSLADYLSLDKVLAAFVEAMRLFPPVYIMVRDAEKEGVITVPDPFSPGETQTIVIPEGGQVIVDVVGLLRNPHNFEDPLSYKPSRWYGLVNEAESIAAFGNGPRTCVGKKFGTTEAVCFLACLLRDWKLEPLLTKGETSKEWSERVLEAKFGVTLGLKDAALRFVRRRKVRVI